MGIRFAERMDRLGTEGAFEVLARARRLEAAGQHIVHLEIGEPDFATPDNITEAAVAAMNAGYTHYTPAGGIMEARESVAGFVSRRLGIDVDPTEVVLVPGSKNVLLFVLLACVEPGDEVIYPDPGYPIYQSLANFVGAVPVPVRLREERDFRMDLDELAALVTPRTRLLILNSPQNPTGGVLTRQDVAFVARLAVEHDLIVLSDEIYSQIVYGPEHVSVLVEPGMKERTVLMDGMSTAYAMCGRRRLPAPGVHPGRGRPAAGPGADGRLPGRAAAVVAGPAGIADRLGLDAASRPWLDSLEAVGPPPGGVPLPRGDDAAAVLRRLGVAEP